MPNECTPKRSQAIRDEQTPVGVKKEQLLKADHVRVEKVI